jgi:hypothetical protein
LLGEGIELSMLPGHNGRPEVYWVGMTVGYSWSGHEEQIWPQSERLAWDFGQIGF